MKAFTDYAPVDEALCERALSDLPLGQEPRALLPRRALVPERQGIGRRRLRRRGAPDLAPTAPQAVRDAFATLLPPLCATRCRRRASPRSTSPSRTLLGARQYAAFVKAIEASTATWKVVVNETPIQQFYELPTTAGRAMRPSATQLLHDPAGREERRLPHHRHAREPDRRGAAADARAAAARSARGSGRSSPVPSRRTRTRRRSTAISASAAPATSSRRSSSSRRRRAGSACAAPPRTSTATARFGDRDDADRDAEDRVRGAGPREDRRALRPARSSPRKA